MTQNNHIKWRSQIVLVNADTGEIINDYHPGEWVIIRKQINHIIRDGAHNGTREVQWLIRPSNQYGLFQE